MPRFLRTSWTEPKRNRKLTLSGIIIPLFSSCSLSECYLVSILLQAIFFTTHVRTIVRLFRNRLRFWNNKLLKKKSRKNALITGRTLRRNKKDAINSSQAKIWLTDWEKKTYALVVTLLCSFVCARASSTVLNPTMDRLFTKWTQVCISSSVLWRRKLINNNNH